MKRIFYLLLLFVSLSGVLKAVPAYPGLITTTQPDGTTISYYMKGDENFHFMTSEDGYLIAYNSDNIMEYALINDNYEIVTSGIKVSDVAYRTSKEKRYLKNALKASDVVASLQVASERANARAQQRVAQNGDVPVMRYPLQGNPTSLVILVNFQDVQFTYTRENFDSLLNQKGYAVNRATGSANDFFEGCSFGQFSPEFVVVGPYTLPNTVDYYGKNNTYGDARAQNLIIDACRAADSAGVDFSVYDTDGNKKVDNVFVYYAGFNEAEGAPENTIWPHRSAIVSNQEFDGVKLWDYACTSEMKGNAGSTMCGIGTFCHEFGHVLGLPDFYCTDYSHDEPTLGSWDAMDQGPYNNGGKTPPSYSAYERFFLGWMTPTILEPGYTEVQPLVTTNTAYILSKEPHNLNGARPDPKEFFMIENRQRIGWDSVGLPGEGLLVTHIDYSAAKWLNNNPNNDPNDMGAQIVCASGTTRSPEYNTFPGKANVKTCFLTMKDGYQFPDPLTSIKQDDSSRIISFVYGETPTTPYISKEGDISYFNVPYESEEVREVEIFGHNLVGPVKISLKTGYHFMIREAGSGKGFSREVIAEVNADSTFRCKIEVQYKPRRLSNGEIFEDLLRVDAQNYNIFYNMSGIANKAIKVFPPVAYEAKEITENSFVANWAYQEFATLYYLSVFRIENTPSSEVNGFDSFATGKLSEGWSSNFTESNRQYFGAAKPSVYFKNSTDTLWTEKYFLPVNKISFWVRSVNTIGVLHVDGLVDNQWTSIATFDISAGTKDATLSFDLGEVVCQQFKLYYEITSGTGGLTFDDFTAEYDKTVNFKLDHYEVYDTMAMVGGLEKNATYYYRVQASDKDENNSKVEENITDYSNEISVTLGKVKAEKNVELKLEVTAEGVVIADLGETPKPTAKIFIYTAEGHLVDVIVPEQQKVQLPALPENNIYIIKYSSEGTPNRQGKYAKLFY